MTAHCPNKGCPTPNSSVSNFTKLSSIHQEVLKFSFLCVRQVSNRRPQRSIKIRSVKRKLSRTSEFGI
jgi:hypothetical protein